MKEGHRHSIELHGERPAATSRQIGRVVLRRMGLALRFDRTVYAEVVTDPTGLRQAAWVVRIVTAAVAIGTILLVGWHIGALLSAVVAALLHWLIWTGVTHIMVTWLFRRQTSLRQLLIAMGYAQTPRVLAIFGCIPVVGPWLVVVSGLLSAGAGHQALEQTTDVSRRQALATTVIAYLIGMGVSALVHGWLGDIGPWEAVIRP